MRPCPLFGTNFGEFYLHTLNFHTQVALSSHALVPRRPFCLVPSPEGAIAGFATGIGHQYGYLSLFLPRFAVIVPH